MLQNTERRQLGQLRPANTTAASVYSPSGSNTLAEIDLIIVCNTTTSAVDYRIFYDANGTTYDETTALFFDVEIAANTTTIIELSDSPIPITSSGNIGVRTATNNALNFTVFGAERIN